MSTDTATRWDLPRESTEWIGPVQNLPAGATNLEFALLPRDQRPTETDWTAALVADRGPGHPPTGLTEGVHYLSLLAALERLVAAPNWCGLTVCEVNPDHGERDGSTLEDFASRLALVLAGAFDQ